MSRDDEPEGYALRPKEDALSRSAAEKGTLKVDGSLADLVKYGETEASKDYEKAFRTQERAFKKLKRRRAVTPK